MEPNKLRYPSTWEEGFKHQHHMAMNASVLNPLAHLCHNEHKAIARAKKQTNLEWDRFQVTLQNTFEVLKPTLVKLTSSHIL